jgi:DNA mismatch endonuclease, patch repair protein
LIVALVLGWGFDFMFWGKAIGINFAIYLTACTLGGTLLLLANGLSPSFKSLWLIVPFLFFACFTFLRQEPLTKFLGYTFALVSLGLLTVSYQSGHWMRFILFDYIAKFFQLLASIFALPYVYLKNAKIDTARIRRLPLKPVVRGLLIALPVVIFFAVLLAFGDLVFKQKIIDFFRLFDAARIPETILRLIIILFWSYVLLGIFLHAALKSQDEKLIGEDKPVIKPFLGFTEAAIVLGSVSLLFLVFVIIQFRYFFGGEVNIGVEGFTYSEYERSVRMSHIRHENTDLETIVRKFLFSKGFRYRINDGRYPGSPDIVLPKYRTMIFVHGCFWHGHNGCKKARLPKTRREYWAKKVSENIERDNRFIKILKEEGWKVIVIWGCELENVQIKNHRLEELIYKIKANSIDYKSKIC